MSDDTINAPAPAANGFALFWISEDEQGSIPLGTYPTEDEARDAIIPRCVELIKQCTDDQQRERIYNGRWDVVPCE